MTDNNQVFRPGNKQSPKEVFYKFLPYWPWLVVSLIICIGAAYLKLRYSATEYGVYGKILVKDKNPYGKSNEKFSSIFTLPDDNSNLNNEIEIIKSRSMAARVVRRLGLQKRYSIRGNIRTSAAHFTDLPFDWQIEHVEDSSSNFLATISLVDDQQFKIVENSKTFAYGQPVEFNGVRFKLISKPDVTLGSKLVQYILEWVPEESMAIYLSSNISVVRSEGASVLNISFPVENKKIGLDIVNGYMTVYQESSLQDKKQIAYNTAIFINEQLDTLQRELGGVEQSLQEFRVNNEIFNQEGQTSLFFSELQDANKQLTDFGVKLKVVDYLRDYINNKQNEGKTVPSTLGIEEPSLVEQISSYNQLQIEREIALRNNTPLSIPVKRLETAIAATRENILQNLQNIRNGYRLAIEDIEKRLNQTSTAIRSMPSKEKQLLEVTRRQNILQELYSFLLQKRIETAISSASTISDIDILEPAWVRNTPLSPNRKTTYLLALLIGALVPAGIIFLIDYLNDKVQSRQDVQRATDAPVLGELGHATDTQTLVVKQNERSYIAEQFRIIRSNLQYVLPKDEIPIILVTSSFSGEGKSFVSTNLGAVLALSGKKTLIMEMDIRKPKIMKGLGMHERRGFTNYMVGDVDSREIIYPVQDIEGLYVLSCGPIPPNPSEMLLNPKLAKLMTTLRAQFDAIIIDSAPIGLVSDSVTLGTHANASVYIVRHNYTYKKQLEFVDGVYKENKLPNLSIVINDISQRGAYSGYYGYGSYGYGYGADEKDGGYFQNSSSEKKRNWWKKIFNRSQ